MVVCLCRAVGDRAVAEAIRQGARCAREIAEACGAGTDCRGCWETLEQLARTAAAAPGAVARPAWRPAPDDAEMSATGGCP